MANEFPWKIRGITEVYFQCNMSTRTIDCNPLLHIKFFYTMDTINLVFKLVNNLKYYLEIDGVMVFPEKHQSKYCIF